MGDIVVPSFTPPHAHGGLASDTTPQSLSQMAGAFRVALRGDEAEKDLRLPVAEHHHAQYSLVQQDCRWPVCSVHAHLRRILLQDVAGNPRRHH